jgi:glycosyltransferase involved in cell wall biosynthesis
VAIQSYPWVEHLVLDGGSTDGTKAYLETSPGCVTWWRSHPDNGQTQALNEGFSKASGDWIGWQNSDDFYYPGAFWRIADIVTTFQEAEVIVGDTVIVDQHGRALYLIGVSPVPAKLWLQGYWPYNQAVFIHHDLLLKILPVDESLHIHMDTDMLAKIALLEPRVVYMNHALGAFRKYEGTKTEALTDRSWHERNLLKERYKQRMWPKEGIQWQLHRIMHHIRVFQGFGVKALIRRLGQRCERNERKKCIIR